MNLFARLAMFLALVFRSRLRSGLFYQLRVMKSPRGVFRLLLGSSRATQALQADERVVIAGVGIAALTLAENLKRIGHRNVTWIGRSKNFGGKCVNSGCMPSEYFYSKREMHVSDSAQGMERLISELRGATAERIRALGFRFLEAEATHVKGKKLVLSDGAEVEFDRLVLATGNTSGPAGRDAKLLGAVHSVEDFWALKEGRLLIVSDSSPAALGLAAMAADRGLKTTLCYTAEPVLSTLPSFQYFSRNLQKTGVKIISRAELVERKDGSLVVRVRNGSNSDSQDIEFDSIVYCGTPTPRLIPVDGKIPSLLELDHASAALRHRPDIHLVGDAAGLLQASEAEVHSIELVRAWVTGDKIDMEKLDTLPLRIHAAQSLAMVGPPWTWLAADWKCVDFQSLGWSAVHGVTGKAWYLYNGKSRRIEAMHICHRDASELVSLASALMELPLDDPRWMTSSVHPSSAEIFKRITEQVQDEHGLFSGRQDRHSRKGDPASPVRIHLPPLSQMESAAFYLDRFTESERRIGSLDEEPALYFSLLAALRDLTGAQTPLKRLNDGEQNYQAELVPDFDYDASLPGKVLVRAAHRSAIVTIEQEPGGSPSNGF